MILFTKSNTWFSKLIRKITKSNVSHCAFHISPNLIVESTVFGGVRIVHVKEFYAIQILVESFPVRDHKYKIAREITEEIILDRYGYMDLFFIILKNLFKLKITELTGRGKLCSEALSAYLDKVYGTNLNNIKDPKDPNHLREWCRENINKLS